MKEILEAVMRRLKEQVPDLAYVSEDWGQMDYYNEAPPVKFPCALISVSHIGFESETWGGAPCPADLPDPYCRLSRSHG